MGNEQLSVDYFKKKLSDAKTHFERALDCKHTEFDDLYPYMLEHPQFFWYKRYVAWSELLTIVNICEELSLDWQEQFTSHQIQYIRERVMSSTVLDYWFEKNDSKEHVGQLRKDCKVIMISDAQLDEWRVSAQKIRVIRDADEANDVKGFVVAWDSETVIIRKQNRRVLKLSRNYIYQPLEMERIHPFQA